MTRELTEKELLKEFLSYLEYHDFAMKVYKEMLESEQFKRPEPVCFTIQNYQISKTEFLHVEASIIKLENGVNNFGFVRIVLTDEFDFTLDRWNEVKKIMTS